MNTQKHLWYPTRDGRAFWMGYSWPAGAKVHAAARRRFGVVIDPLGECKMDVLDAPLDDVLGRAAEMGAKRGSSVSVVREVGSYGGRPLFESIVTYGDEVRKAGHTGEMKEWSGLIAKQSEVPESDGVRIAGVASSRAMDRDFDILEPKAFEDDIERFMRNPIMLFNHNPQRPVGIVTSLKLNDDDVRFEGLIDHDEDVKALIRKKIVRAVSVQFLIKARELQDPEFDSDGIVVTPPIQRITKAELLEIGPVSIPAHQDAIFEVRKSLQMDACCSGPLCGCAPASRVVAYRELEVAEAGAAFDANTAKIARLHGREAAESCCGIDGLAGETFQHSALVGDDLRLIPDLVRLSMAKILARERDDLDEEQYRQLWGAMAKRWVDCGLGTPPAMEKYPAPGLYARISGLADRATSLTIHRSHEFPTHESARKWLNLRGFRGTIADVGGSTILRIADGDDKSARKLCVAGQFVTAALASKSESEPEAEKETDMDKNDNKTDPAPEPKKTPDADPPKNENDLIEVDSEDLALLQAAVDGAPLSENAVERLENLAVETLDEIPS